MENRYCFKFASASIKKSIISDFVLTKCVKKNSTTEPADFIAEITPGSKFIAEEFIKEAFVYPSKYDWIRIRVVSTMTEGT